MLSATIALMAMGSEVLHFASSKGPGKGKHIVMLAGDEEYRSEEMLPQLAKILSNRYGFECTVVFSQNDRGEIDPDNQIKQPGIEALKKADVCIMMLRFRHWDDTSMQHFADYYLAGKPIIAIRTSTHAFAYPADSTSPFKDYSWNSKTWPGGFGKQVLGETWVSHWGNHGSQATRGHIVSSHQLMHGVENLFGTTDVYEASPPPDAEILVRGEVVSGMKSTDEPATGMKRTSSGNEQLLNKPMMPIAWVREPMNSAKRTNKILTTTIGAATDFLNPGYRRFLINSVFWAANLEVSKVTNIDLVGKYEPSKFGFGGFRKGVKPLDHLELTVGHL
ncbi:MAG: hypothetical protein WCI55_10360 [Armatimonadota bacterium]